MNAGRHWKSGMGSLREAGSMKAESEMRSCLENSDLFLDQNMGKGRDIEHGEKEDRLKGAVNVLQKVGKGKWQRGARHETSE